MTQPKGPTFSKKHYDKLADFLINIRFARQGESEAAHEIAKPLADMLEADNIRFNRERFFKKIRDSYVEGIVK